MNRRTFIKTSSGTVFLFSGATLQSCEKAAPVRFGLVSDVHFARRDRSGSRYYSQSTQKLQAAIDVFNREQLDFIIQLGDYKDQDEQPEKTSTLAFLDEIETVMRQFNGPIYHVLGNHDMDSISKRDFLAHTKNHGDAEGKNHYSFSFSNLKFIVLDANYNEDGSDYDSGNFDWTSSQIPEHQLAWLENELSEGGDPAIVFIHQLLDWFSDVHPSLHVRNAKQVVEILEKSARVAAVFQGHHHPGNYSHRNGIHYITTGALVEGSLPDNNCFATVEIDATLNIRVNGYYNCRTRSYGKAAYFF